MGGTIPSSSLTNPIQELFFQLKEFSKTEIPDTEKLSDSPVNLTTQIYRLLNSRRREQLFSLDKISEYCNTSSRTARRKLASEGTSYSQLVDTWRFTKALSLLKIDKLLISEIATILGYSNSPNFERAFKRWTKTTPGQYRDNLS